MNMSPSVVVNKGGFLAALVKGIFGTIMVVVACGTALGLYGIHVAHKLVGIPVETLAHLPDALQSLPEWESFPPLLADALNDSRNLEYRKSIEIKSECRPIKARHDGGNVVAIDVTNRGDKTVSLMSVRVLVEDEGPYFLSDSLMAATPLGIADWPGPLPPGETRRLLRPVYHVDGEPEVKIEIGDLRTWNGPISATHDPEQPAAPNADSRAAHATGV